MMRKIYYSCKDHGYQPVNMHKQTNFRQVVLEESIYILADETSACGDNFLLFMQGVNKLANGCSCAPFFVREPSPK